MQAIDPRAHRRTSQVLILMEGKSRNLAGHWNWPGKTPPHQELSRTACDHYPHKGSSETPPLSSRLVPTPHTSPSLNQDGTFFLTWSPSLGKRLSTNTRPLRDLLPVCSDDTNPCLSQSPKVSGLTLTYPLEEGHGAQVGGGPGSSVVAAAASKEEGVHSGCAAWDVHRARPSGWVTGVGSCAGHLRAHQGHLRACHDRADSLTGQNSSRVGGSG